MSEATNVLLFFGLPGSGKGTLSALCTQHLSYEQLSTGNLCREHIAKRSEIGKQIDFAIQSGKLVDDSLITSMVLEWFTQNIAQKRVILDGFPRTAIQAQGLDEFVKKAQNLKPLLVQLSIAEDVVIDRLGARRTCSNKSCQAVYSLADESGLKPRAIDQCDICSSKLIVRKDDEAAAIKERLKLYRAHEQALLDFYADAGYPKLQLEANRPIEQVFENLKQHLVKV